MKYVIDECVSILLPNKYSGSNFIKSIDVVGCGACDEKVLGLVKRLRGGLITRDRKFAIHALWDAKTVIYHKPDGTRIQIKPNRTKLSSMVPQGVRLTNYLRATNQVVIP